MTQNPVGLARSTVAAALVLVSACATDQHLNAPERPGTATRRQKDLTPSTRPSSHGLAEDEVRVVKRICNAHIPTGHLRPGFNDFGMAFPILSGISGIPIEITPAALQVIDDGHLVIDGRTHSRMLRLERLDQVLSQMCGMSKRLKWLVADGGVVIARTDEHR